MGRRSRCSCLLIFMACALCRLGQHKQPAGSQRHEKATKLNGVVVAQGLATERRHNVMIDSDGEAEDVFVPGTLNASRLAVYLQCFTDVKRYRNHFRNGINGTHCAQSPKHDLVAHLIPKSGSSTIHEVMKADFEANHKRRIGCHFSQFEELTYRNKSPFAHSTANNKKKKKKAKMYHFSSFRDPTSRFISSYNMMLFRWRLNISKGIPSEYSRFLDTLQGCNASSKNPTDEDKARHRAAFEIFVEDYDGRDASFDNHMKLQLPLLTDRLTGRSIKLDEGMDAKTLKQDLQGLADRLGIQLTRPNIVSNPTKDAFRIDLDSLSPRTIQKICQLSALDYCCLNYRLPAQCRNMVQCRWVDVPEFSGQKLIEAVSPLPPPLP